MVKKLRIVALVSYFSLLIFLFIWIVFLSPSNLFPESLVLLILLVPLLLPVFGIVKGKPYSFVVAAFIVLLYLTWGMGNLIMSDGSRLLSIIEIILSLTFFFSGAFYAKLARLETSS